MRDARRRTPGPTFLEATADVRVRFQEVDPMGIAWHGHYLGYFEVGRAVFGEEYGLDYATMRRHSFYAPIVHAEVDYLRPAALGQTLRVRARLHPEPGAWMVFTYLISSEECEQHARGQTVQAFTDLQGELLLTRPAYYEEWLRRCAPST